MTKEEYESIKNKVCGDKESPDNKESKVGDMWLPLFMTIMAMNNQPNTELEKKVAYLNGKVDTLEKIISGL